MRKIEDILGALLYDKIPPLSDTINKIVFKYLPWIIMFCGVIGLIVILSILGIFSATAALTVSTTGMLAIPFLTSYDLIFMCVLSSLSSILAILSGYWMLKQQQCGWRLALISSLLGFIIHFLHFNIFGILLNLIFIYLLFQIRHYYHN